MTKVHFSKMSKGKDWCATSFEILPPQWHKSMGYLKYQQEKCDTTGKLHWQIYVEYDRDKRRKAVQTTLGETHDPPQMHVELRRGTRTQAADYCSKDHTAIEATTFEAGEREPDTKKGARNDLTELKDKIIAGTITKGQILREDTNMWHQYGRTLQALFDDIEENKPEIWGRELIQFDDQFDFDEVKHDHPNAYFIVGSIDTRTWVRYKGQNEIIFWGVDVNRALENKIKFDREWVVSVPYASKLITATRVLIFTWNLYN